MTRKKMVYVSRTRKKPRGFLLEETEAHQMILLYLRVLKGLVLPIVVFYDMRHRLIRLTRFGPEYSVWKLSFNDRLKFARSTIYHEIAKWWRDRR